MVADRLAGAGLAEPRVEMADGLRPAHVGGVVFKAVEQSGKSLAGPGARVAGRQRVGLGGGRAELQRVEPRQEPGEEIVGRHPPLHHQLDLRVDYSWKWGPTALTFFVDVQNVYMNESIVTYFYGYDFTQRAAFTSIPIIPSLGLRGVL
jgi:hypothetical protein